MSVKISKHNKNYIGDARTAAEIPLYELKCAKRNMASSHDFDRDLREGGEETIPKLT